MSEALLNEPTTCTVEPKSHPHRDDSAKSWLAIYLRLGKLRLTSLVVFTAFVPYYMCGGPVLSIAFPSLIIGTYLQAMAANGLNQVIERHVDALMPRTRLRPLVVGDITVVHALGAVCAAAFSGGAILYLGTNPLTCYLGTLSLLVYVCAYTPLKRIHWLNTWVGTIPGALPPLMGAAAAAGSLGIVAWFSGGVLFLWQIPHFMALSYLCKNEYRAAGFHMLPSSDPDKAAAFAASHSAALAVWCLIIPPFLPCHPYFILEAAALNGALLYFAYQYKSQPGSATARTLFRYSVLYLAVLLGLFMLHRKLPVSKSKSSPASS